jgi:hypothetical protein
VRAASAFGSHHNDRWTAGQTGRGWRVGRRRLGPARGSSGRCRARTLCHVSHSRGPVVERRLGDLGRSPRAFRRVSGCSMGRRARLRRRGVGSGRRIDRGGRCDSLSSLPWTSARRRRSARTPGCARDRWPAAPSSRIPHLRIGAASESGRVAWLSPSADCGLLRGGVGVEANHADNGRPPDPGHPSARRQRNAARGAPTDQRPSFRLHWRGPAGQFS